MLRSLLKKPRIEERLVLTAQTTPHRRGGRPARRWVWSHDDAARLIKYSRRMYQKDIRAKRVVPWSIESVLWRATERRLGAEPADRILRVPTPPRPTRRLLMRVEADPNTTFAKVTGRPVDLFCFGIREIESIMRWSRRRVYSELGYALMPYRLETLLQYYGAASILRPRLRQHIHTT